MTHYFAHGSAVIEADVEIGDGTKIWHFTHIMSGAQIGRNCVLGQNVFVGTNVQIGGGVKIQNNVSIYSGVLIEDDVFIGPSAVFTNVRNPRSFINRKDEFLPTVVRNGVSIGANATVVCGNTIGAFAFVAAGSVIIKDVADFELVAGNPGVRKGWMSKNGFRLNFSLEGIAKCADDGSIYRLQGERVICE